MLGYALLNVALNVAAALLLIAVMQVGSAVRQPRARNGSRQIGGRELARLRLIDGEAEGLRFKGWLGSPRGRRVGIPPSGSSFWSYLNGFVFHQVSKAPEIVTTDTYRSAST